MKKSKQIKVLLKVLNEVKQPSVDRSIDGYGIIYSSAKKKLAELIEAIKVNE